MERISYSKIAFGVVFFIPHLRKGIFNVFAVNVDGKLQHFFLLKKLHCPAYNP